MYLSRHRVGDLGDPGGARWALDGRYLPAAFSLDLLLELRAADVAGFLESFAAREAWDAAGDPLLPPLEPAHEVWASGVTYERSRDAREAESEEKDAYERVYGAERPELFFKAAGWRVAGHGGAVRVRADSGWDVPEPELVLVVNGGMEIVGYTAGNDVSSRSIEGENPLYLPQAKIFDGSCSLGPGIVLPVGPEELRDLPVGMRVEREGAAVFEDGTSTARMKRTPEELAAHLGKELSFPSGAFLMTGTGVVPGEDFTLAPGDNVEVRVGGLTLANDVVR